MVGEEGEAVSERKAATVRPFPWWFVPAYPVGWTATYFIAAVSLLGSVAFFLAWFTGLVVLTVREKRIRGELRALGPVRATVVPELEARGVPIRVVASSGRRELPSAERVG